MSKKFKARIDDLADLHHQAGEVQRYSFMCMEGRRLSLEWMLKARHAIDRMELVMRRIESTIKDQDP